MRDIEDDLDDVDGVEDVFLTFVGTAVEVEVPASRHQISVREAAASGGAYTTADTIFNIASKRLDSPPGVGSLVKTDDRLETWTVNGVDRAAARTRLRLWCKQVAVLPPPEEGAPEASEFIVIEKPTYTKDKDGMKTATWTDLQVDVVARIQEMQSETIVEVDRRRVKITTQIFVEGLSAEVNAGMRVRRASGERLLIRRLTGRTTVGGLVVLEAERARTPAES